MKCPNCGHELADNVRFCVNCGTKIETASAQPAQQPQQTKPAEKPQPAPQAKPAAMPELTLNHSAYHPDQPAQPTAQAPSVSSAGSGAPAEGTAAAGAAAAGAAAVGTAAVSQMSAQAAQNPRPVQNAQPSQPAQPVQNAQPVRPVQPQQNYAPVQSYQQRPVQSAQPSYELDERSKPYGTGRWMLVQFLEGIPLIGFICQLVWAFGSGNISRRNYARARLIWLIIGIVLSVLFSVLFAREFGGVVSRIKNIIDNYGVEALLNGLKDPLV